MLTLISMLSLAVPVNMNGEPQDDKKQKALPRLTLEEPSAVPS